MPHMNGPVNITPRNNPYNRTEWQDDLIDPVTGEIIEEGTTFWAEYANNFEWGIWNAYQYLIDMYRRLERLQVQMELDGRVPGNSGSFIDTFDGTTTRLTLLKTSTDVLKPVTSADTVISVANSEGFAPMTYATIYDADSYEHVLITAVEVGQITVQALTGDYSKGAKIARSTTVPNINTQTMDVAPFVTFSVDLVEV
ncbi:MAG: hypothetical protein ABS939_04700 [Psychrobacillus sp.]